VCTRLYDYIIFWFNAEAATDAPRCRNFSKKHPHAFIFVALCLAKVESCAGAFLPLFLPISRLFHMCDIDACSRCVSCFIVIIKACHLTRFGPSFDMLSLSWPWDATNEARILEAASTSLTWHWWGRGDSGAEIPLWLKIALPGLIFCGWLRSLMKQKVIAQGHD